MSGHFVVMDLGKHTTIVANKELTLVCVERNLHSPNKLEQNAV